MKPTIRTRIAAALTALRNAITDAPASMSTEDRSRWAAADSLADVADLTAAWLSGELASQPNYGGTVDTDEDTAPGMTQALIALNRTGVVVTTDSQAGGATWNADVHGFIRADLADQLAALTAAHGLTFTRVRRAWLGAGALSHREITDDRIGYGICRPAAVRDLQRAVQFAIGDPQPNRNTVLWPALRDAAGQLVDFRTVNPS